jgi:hypothetical protein
MEPLDANARATPEDMDPQIAGYIRANRGTYTRGAISQRLVEAGHDRAEIDAAWERLAEQEPMVDVRGRNLAQYVWVVYGLGAAIILLLTIGGLSFLGVVWLVAYLLAGFWPARALARQRPDRAVEMLFLIVGAPLVFLFIGGGICFATVLVFLAGMGGVQ